jgi:hypothetical protein
MALFLVTCVCDEGVSPRSFRVVEAPSRLAVAASILRQPDSWAEFLRRSYLWEEVRDRRWSAEQLLAKIDASSVDGDSRYQMAILEIPRIEKCAESVGPCTGR